MDLLQIETTAILTYDYMVELGNLCTSAWDTPIVDLQQKMKQIRKLYRYADSKYQQIYIENVQDAINELGKTKSVHFRNTILQGIIIDLEQHIQYMAVLWKEMNTPIQPPNLSDALQQKEKKEPPRQLAHILKVIEERKRKH